MAALYFVLATQMFFIPYSGWALIFALKHWSFVTVRNMAIDADAVACL